MMSQTLYRLKATIRKATVADAAWMATLCHQQFQHAHRGGFIPDDLLYYVNKTFTEKAIREDLLHTDSTCIIAVSGEDRPVGCVTLGPPNLELAQGEKDAVELTRLYVEPAFIGTGTGALLMEAAIEACRKMKSATIWLHVYENNLTAIRFYEKWGFVRQGTQGFPVRDSEPVGWVMKKMMV